MTASSHDETSVGSPRFLLGVSLKVASVVAFTVMSGLVKAAGPFPAGEVVFFRSFFALIPILAFLWWTKHLSDALVTKNPLGHVRRAMAGVLAMSAFFYGIARIPLPEATALGYASPLFIVILSALVLREQVRLLRWTAVVAGMVGVLIVFWPRLTVFGSGAEPASLETALGATAILAGTFMTAWAMIFVRALVATDKTHTIVLYFTLASSAASLLSIPFGWQLPDGSQAALLVGAGILGGIGQLLLTEGYRHAEASLLAPFEYLSLLVAIAIGYAFFAETPSFSTLAGGAIVIASGLFIIWRERQLGLKRGARRVATPQG